MRKIAACPIALIALVAAKTGVATAQRDFLPPEQAYRYEVRRVGSTIEVHWHIAPGYYLYKSRMSLATTTPGVTLGTPIYPRGQTHKDEFFGSQEIYRESVVISVPFKVQGAQPNEVALTLKWQGCADRGLCYPPTTWTASVSL